MLSCKIQQFLLLKIDTYPTYLFVLRSRDSNLGLCSNKFKNRQMIEILVFLTANPFLEGY